MNKADSQQQPREHLGGLSLVSGLRELICVEGEFDALAFAKSHSDAIALSLNLPPFILRSCARAAKRRRWTVPRNRSDDQVRPYTSDQLGCSLQAASTEALARQ